MYLKKIISSGFKSFADKISITLDKAHITGIVGPNGSGKSNVIDAVRWVMGEQNAKMLRGEKTTDIIFSGSERRKGLGMAEVTLVFDNSEGSPFCPPEYRHEPEIALTRRLYIDGEREYLINRKPCRLKDLVNFFSSTGLGGRSYSMIQQGQVDRILQAKPEQIREILEEAAGTLVFKNRRQESWKKLEATRLNLSRIDDILKEVDRQIESLRVQVEKAERWQKLSDDLRQKEISLFAQNYLHFKQRSEELKGQITAASDKELASLADNSYLDARYTELKLQLDEADPELHALTEEITVLREKIASSEASLASAQQILESGEQQCQALRHELQEDEKSFAVLSKQLADAEQNVVSAEQEAEDLAALSEEQQQRLEIAEEESMVFQRTIESLSEERRKIERLIDSNKLKRESIERDFSKASRQKAEHTDRLLQLEEEYSHSQILAEGAQIKVKNSQKGLDQELEEKNQLELRALERRERLIELRGKADKNKEAYLELKARLSSLEELELHADDSLALVQKLQAAFLQAQEDCLCTLLTSVVSFSPEASSLPQKLLASLEKWADRLLVLDEQHLEQISTKIHELGSGALPASLLSQASRHGEAVRLWASQHGLEPLHGALKIDQDLPQLAELLARLYALPAGQGISQALLASLPAGAVLFTSQGDTYSGGDDLLLGASKIQGALSRKQQIADLEEKLQATKSRLEQNEEKLHRLEQQEEKEKSLIKELDARIFAKNREVLQLMAELQATEQKIALRHEQIIEARQQYQKWDDQCEKYAADLEDLQQNEYALDEEKVQTLSALEDAKAQAEELKDEREEIQRQYNQQKIAIASAQSRAHTLREHFEQDHGQLATLTARVQRRREEEEKLLARFSQAQEKQVQLERDIEAFIFQREEREEKLAAKREDNAGLLEELRVIENRLKEGREAIRLAQKAVAEREIDLERLRLSLAGVKEQALEKYQLDLEEHPCELLADFDAGNQARQVGALRARIEEMGPVNMMAISEFRDLQARQNFISAQKNEVVSSVELLELAIEEIEETSKSKFLETFVTLNKEFMELFPILFPRGEGHIQLTDPTNPLEAGVEIMVRLPGKSQQNMRLFSGGEKALTAIALIFALLKSKPTPFCFLDEVDAPLDETNVSRYNKVLETLSDRFQFIVITHRRRTMEVLDTLYGVTMQEPGVSKVVGVDLTKALPTHLQKAFKETPSPIRAGATAAP